MTDTAEVLTRIQEAVEPFDFDEPDIQKRLTQFMIRDESKFRKKNKEGLKKTETLIDDVIKEFYDGAIQQYELGQQIDTTLIGDEPIEKEVRQQLANKEKDLLNELDFDDLRKVLPITDEGKEFRDNVTFNLAMTQFRTHRNNKDIEGLRALKKEVSGIAFADEVIESINEALSKIK